MFNPGRLGRYGFPICVLLCGCLLVPAAVLAQEAERKVYYRYTNDQGVQVLEDRIPPKYVAKGYEVVSLTGEVIKTVDPAPTAEEAKRMEQEQQARREQERYDKELKRRYSTVKDIRDAKRRNLADLQGNISILESNLNNVRNQISDLETRAARIERSGGQVSDTILNNLSTLRAEVVDLQVQIEQREQEYQAAEEKFDRDIERFREIVQARNKGRD